METRFCSKNRKTSRVRPTNGETSTSFGPRIGKRDSGVGEIPEEFFQLKNSLESLDINSPEYLQNLQDFKNKHLESSSDQENSSRDLDIEDHSSNLRGELADLDPEELGMILEKRFLASLFH